MRERGVTAADARAVRQTQKALEDTLTPFRIGVAVGAIGTAVFLLRASSALPFDVLTWSVFAFVVACGGAFVGGAVLAWQNAREAPEIVLRAAGLLALLSLLPLGHHYREARKAAAFMETADSARGVVVRRYVRGGLHLTVTFQVNADPHSVMRKVRSQERDLRVGDSIWVYFQPGAPQEAFVGKPGPDPQTTFMWLAIIWVIGGVLLLGYWGPLLVKGARSGHPEPSPARGLGEGAA